MAGTPWKAGPAAMAVTSEDIAGVNPAANTYRKIFHIHVANDAAAGATYSLWVGLTGGEAAGTEIASLKALAASGTDDIYFPSGLRIATTDFLSGQASATTVVITVTGETFAL